MFNRQSKISFCGMKKIDTNGDHPLYAFNLNKNEMLFHILSFLRLTGLELSKLLCMKVFMIA